MYYVWHNIFDLENNKNQNNVNNFPDAIYTNKKYLNFLEEQ